MDATEFFQQIIEPNYAEATRAPDDLRLLLNAIITMNTVAEFVALDRSKYGKIGEEELTRSANQIRRQFPCLEDLQFCAAHSNMCANSPTLRRMPISLLLLHRHLSRHRTLRRG
jgi:hypothetical protein